MSTARTWLPPSTTRAKRDKLQKARRDGARGPKTESKMTRRAMRATERPAGGLRGDLAPPSLRDHLDAPPLTTERQGQMCDLCTLFIGCNDTVFRTANKKTKMVRQKWDDLKGCDLGEDRLFDQLYVNVRSSPEADVA